MVVNSVKIDSDGSWGCSSAVWGCSGIWHASDSNMLKSYIVNYYATRSYIVNFIAIILWWSGGQWRWKLVGRR